MKARNILASLAAVVAFAMPAFADAKKEEFVRENGQRVLASLNDASLSAADRTAKFGQYMEEFTDMDRVAYFVLGKHRRQFSEAERNSYLDAFKRYALAVYEVELDRYRGEEIKVTGSVDRSEDDSIVQTVIRRGDGEEMEVLWRVQEREGELQVMDVALNIEGNLIWLAIEQRAQIIAVADRARDPAAAVIEKLNQMTDKLEREKREADSQSG